MSHSADATDLGTPLLILAHPGHELRLFHWMERARPLVFILTDGSGGSATSRIAYSADCIRAAGAQPGRAAFGVMPDRAWYDALRGRNTMPFLAAVAGIAAEAAVACGASPLVVADPVEGYNPMHDLCSAVADAVATRLGPSSQRRTFALTTEARLCGSAGLTLDAAALTRKRAAIAAYAPLAEEAARLLAAEPAGLGQEGLLPSDFDWPARMTPPPAYEAFGQERVRSGRYEAPITYAEHVLPMARAIRDPV
jgi:hypothetical protein